MSKRAISRTKSYRYLGLLVDEKFSWTYHIDEICSKLSQIAGVIFKIRSLLTKEALMLVYGGQQIKIWLDLLGYCNPTGFR